MLIYFGNPRPRNNRDGDSTTPTYTRTKDVIIRGEDPNDPEYGLTFDPDADLDGVWRDLARSATSGITHIEGNQIVAHLIAPGSSWATFSHAEAPTWVVCESHLNADVAHRLQDFLARVFECRSGAPEDLEQTHLTFYGPPGVGPGCEGWDGTAHPMAPSLDVAAPPAAPTDEVQP